MADDALGKFDEAAVAVFTFGLVFADISWGLLQAGKLARKSTAIPKMT